MLTNIDLPTALQKGKCQCTYPISSYVTYDHLSSGSCSFVASIDSVGILRSVHQALSHPGWRDAMLQEMNALTEKGTWDLVNLPIGQKVVGSKWIFAVKFNFDESVACLVAKGYAQTDCLFISLAATYDWPLYQIDIKNAFLHGDFQEKVYMEQPLEFVTRKGLSPSKIIVWFEKKALEIGLKIQSGNREVWDREEHI